MYKKILKNIKIVAVAGLIIMITSGSKFAQINDDVMKNSYLSIARIYYENGESDKSIYYLDRILEIDKYASDALKLLISIHIEKGSFEKAKPLLVLLKDINENDLDLFYYKAYIDLELEQYQDALDQLYLLLEIDPEHEPGNALLIKVQELLKVKPVAPFEINFMSAI